METQSSNAARKFDFDFYERNLNTDLEPGHPKALIVEDDPFSQKLFAHIIRDTFDGFKIIIAGNYDEAKRVLLTTNEVKFAIVDIFLGDSKSGLDLLNYLRLNGWDMPVMITSSVPHQTFHQMVNPRIKTPVYLQKPFQPKSCQFVLEEFLAPKDNNE